MSERKITVEALSLADIGKRVEVGRGDTVVRGVLWSISYEQNWHDVTTFQDQGPRREPAVTSVTLDVSDWRSPDLPLYVPVTVWDD